MVDNSLADATENKWGQRLAESRGTAGPPVALTRRIPTHTPRQLSPESLPEQAAILQSILSLT